MPFLVFPIALFALASFLAADRLRMILDRPTPGPRRRALGIMVSEAAVHITLQYPSSRRFRRAGLLARHVCRMQEFVTAGISPWIDFLPRADFVGAGAADLAHDPVALPARQHVA